jgi:hypothetical protein
MALGEAQDVKRPGAQEAGIRRFRGDLGGGGLDLHCAEPVEIEESEFDPDGVAEGWQRGQEIGAGFFIAADPGLR